MCVMCMNYHLAAIIAVNAAQIDMNNVRLFSILFFLLNTHARISYHSLLSMSQRWQAAAASVRKAIIMRTHIHLWQFVLKNTCTRPIHCVWPMPLVNNFNVWRRSFRAHLFEKKKKYKKFHTLSIGATTQRSSVICSTV